jgi:hypothetical protein
MAKIDFETDGNFEVQFETLHEIPPSDIDVYDGAYTVDPDFERHVLGTKSKLMRDDVTVNAIEVQRVSNAAGGRTVYIGGLING